MILHLICELLSYLTVVRPQYTTPPCPRKISGYNAYFLGTTLYNTIKLSIQQNYFIQSSSYIAGRIVISILVCTHIYVCVNCQGLHNYAELHLYTHKQNEALLRSSLFLRG